MDYMLRILPCIALLVCLFSLICRYEKDMRKAQEEVDLWKYIASARLLKIKKLQEQYETKQE